MPSNNNVSSLRVFRQWIKELTVGFCIGIANIIPGVSGGTFLLIFGIYERVIGIVNRFSFAVIIAGLKSLLSVVGNLGRRQSVAGFAQFLKTYDITFLCRILIGAAGAIVVLSSIMKMLLTKHFSPTYAFFFGLIVVSIIIPLRLMRTKRAIHLLFFMIGTALTLYTTIAVNPYDKALGKSEEYKSRMIQQKAGTADQNTAHASSFFSYSGRYTAGEYLYVAFSGSVAICAMILPGISGSFVLILMGQYFEVISAIADLKTLALDYFLFLAAFGAGLLIGIYFFAKLVDYVFKHYYDATMAFLVGLMAGSLYTLWPFKQYIIMDQYVKSGGVIEIVRNAIIYTNINTLPQSTGQAAVAAGTFILGVVVMLYFVKNEAKPALEINTDQRP